MRCLLLEGRIIWIYAKPERHLLHKKMHTGFGGTISRGNNVIIGIVIAIIIVAIVVFLVSYLMKKKTKIDWMP